MQTRCISHPRAESYVVAKIPDVPIARNMKGRTITNVKLEKLEQNLVYVAKFTLN